jgi:ADP-ribose pyrophosphatase YjhB (NUDIX family)
LTDDLRKVRSEAVIVEYCSDEPRMRPAVRALVVRPDDAVLLVHFEFGDGSEVWATPGGGIEAGESEEDAIRRELAEEVGVRLVELGPLLWTRSHVFALSADFDGQRERVFLVRVADAPGQPLMSVAELRAEGVTESRWWTAAELAASSEVFAPRRLPELVAQVLAEGAPDEPIDAGV